MIDWKEIALAMEKQLRHEKHIPVVEQQTGHIVCAWCGDCDGSCQR